MYGTVDAKLKSNKPPKLPTFEICAWSLDRTIKVHERNFGSLHRDKSTFIIENLKHI